MQLEVNTLLVVNVANVTLLASTLPFIMGQQLSVGAASARRALIAQALGWMAMIASGYWPDTWIDGALSTVSMSLWVAANWMMFLALCAWLGPRPMRRLMLALVIVTPIGYGFFFGSYPLRVGWSNFLLAAQLLILAWAARRPQSQQIGPWRGVFALTLVLMAALTTGRGVLGAFFPEVYPHFTAPHPWNQAAMLLANVALVLLNVTFLVAWREEAELQLRAQALTDPLTGLLNRRGWAEMADRHLGHAQRHGGALAVLVLDLDFFKQINDLHGHDVGDQALRLFSSVLREEMRKGDLVARAGGEEFFVMLQQTDETQARAYENRVRQLLLARTQQELGFALNFSSGLAQWEQAQESLDMLMARADAALYRAKMAGRGRLSL